MNAARPARPRATVATLLLAVVVAACSPQARTSAPAPEPSAGAAATAAAATPSASTAGNDYASWKPAGMTDAQADRVVSLSLDAVLRLGVAAGYEGGYIVTLGGTRAYLGNMALSLVGQPEDRWPDLITDHFRTAFAQPSASGDPVPSTWQEARLFLRVAVRATGYFAADAVTRTIAGDLVQGLVYDQPTSFVVVPRQVFERWGIGEDEAFATGLANTLLEPGMNLDKDESDSLVYAIDSSFASTYVLAVDRLFAQPSPNGALVGVPTRSKVIAVPIRNATVIDALQQYPGVIRKDYDAGPYPVSPLLYWWHNGTLVPISNAAGKPAIPAELQKILDSLGG